MCVSGGFCIGEMMRFREIVSVETIVDDATGKKYIGIVDSAFIDLINQIVEENEQLKKEIKAKDKIIELYYEMVKE